jgi:uncharacterized protein (DUF58 family)
LSEGRKVKGEGRIDLNKLQFRPSTLSLLPSVLSFPSRVVRWMMRSRPIRFTRFGTFYILFAIGVGAAAINTGNNLLYLILGILLGFIVISGFLSDSGLWGIRTEWHPIGSLYAGEKAVFECRVSKSWFPGVAVTIGSHWKGIGEISTFAPWIRAHSSVPLRIAVTPPERGYLELESCLYSTRFPFGLFQKSHTRQMTARWVVYPKVQRLRRDFFERLGREASRESSERLGRGSVPFVLRDYRTGDALRQVHWKATAKRQRLIVKEMEEETSEGDLFILNAWPVQLDRPAMERFISFVASLIFTAHENGRPVGLAVPERVFKPENSRFQLHRIFEFLALVEPKKGRPPDNRRTVAGRHGDRVTDVLALWKQHVIPAVVSGNPSSWIPDRGLRG